MVLAWAVLLIAVVGIGAAKPAVYANDIKIPGSQAQAASDILAKAIPSQSGDRSQIVLTVKTGKVTDPKVAARVELMLGKVAKLPHVATVVSPYSKTGRGQTSKDGRIAFAVLDFDQLGQKLPKAAIQKVIDTAKAAGGNGLQVELGGQAIALAERQPPVATEAIGLLAAIIILLLTFGSVVAMGLPVVTALFGLGVGVSLLGLLSHVLDTADFAPQLAAMIGLGVGIDYSLFIVSRFRDAYASNGGDHHEAIVESMTTAGRSVLFAGMTVVIAILGMVLLGISFLYGVAIATSMVVLVTMLAALTLTPALLGFNVFGGRIGRGRTKRRGAEREGQMWARWADVVVRHRWICAIGGTAVLVALTIPAFGMRQMHNDAGNDGPDQTTRKAYELLATGFGPGFNGPMQIVVTLPKDGKEKALTGVDRGLKAVSGIAQVTVMPMSKDRTTGVLVAYPKSSPQSEETTALVQDLRKEVAPKLARQTGTHILVGGFTPATIDLANIFSSKLPMFIIVVVLLSAFLLMLVFRSVLVPIKAAVMNLLSIGAALGVVTLVFQEGWGASLFGIEPGPIEPFLPVMMFAIIFGLSMDYEVFIVSRIREEWTISNNPRAAVRHGLAATGRVVTAAATIMVCVFGSFMFGGDKIIMMFGVGLATAVFLDAFLIRVILLPAIMDLAANATWWLPKWLDRLLPNVGIEGPEEQS
ncbi:MAG: MMPL family transporter [Solirubrobacterales bacterium]|nr:MMPL family transporter [Solirubrobacterales bacterium]